MIFLGLTTTVNLFKASFESSISPTPDTKETATQASRIFLAVQDSSISDIVCRSVGRSEPTNNQSLGSIKE